MKFIKFIITLFYLVFLSFCFAGGYTEKGGHIYSLQIFESASNVYTDEYYIICIDNEKFKANPEETDISKFINYIRKEEYKGGCEQTGEASQFYLFHMFPTSGKLDPEYAINTTVQKWEGDTMINIRSWQETHYYTFIGQVIVFKVKGDIIKFQLPPNYKAYEKN